MSVMGQNLERFRVAVQAHDRENPKHPAAYGIGLNNFDLERLDFDEGETLWEGVKIYVAPVTTGNFRVLCNAEHKPKMRAVIDRELAHA